MFFSKQTVYADAAAATPLTREAKRRLVELLDVFGNPGALHAYGVAAKGVLEAARKEAADAIGAHADEIVFTASGTESNNIAIAGILESFKNVPISALTLSTEHPSVLEPLRAQEKRGVPVSYMNVDGEGLVSIQALKEAIDETVVLISVALINSEIGVMQDVRAIAKEIRTIRKARAASGNTLPLFLHIDASQAPLWVKLNVEQMHPDLMTLDAQKCGGPKGVGLLYIRRGVHPVPQVLGGGQEEGLRAGTENVPLIGSFARALSEAQKKAEISAAHVASLRNLLLKEIQAHLPQVVVNGSMEHRAPNNLNISIPGLLGDMAVIALSARGTAASTRSACSIDAADLSHVLVALGADIQRAQTALRFTLLPDVSKSDIQKIVDALVHVYAKYHTDFGAPAV